MRIGFVTSHYENLGIEYLSSALKAAGHEVKLYYEPALFHNFFYDSNFLHDRFFSFRERLLARLEKDKPDLVAFSVISDNYRWSAEMARAVRERCGAAIVFGGVHPTSVPEHVLRDRACDYVVVGEAEEALPELAAALASGRDPSGISNVGGWREGKPFLNPPRPLLVDLDSLPFPDKDLFYEECALMVRKSYMAVGSRGCRFACSYCWNSMTRKVYPGGYYRRRSPENLVAELVWARKRYGIERVTFYDEVFTSDPEWLGKFLELYAREVGLPFFCCVHPSEITEETVKLLEKAGCGAVNIGVQTTNEKLAMEALNRSASNAASARALGLLRNTGIYVYSNFMLGLPGQTLEDVENDLLFCARNKADLPAIYWLRYYPGTRILDHALAAGIMTEEQAEKIRESREYLPYAITGNTYNPAFAKLGNLILLSALLPVWLAELIVRRKLYRFLPSANFLFPAIALKAIAGRLLGRKKHPYHYLSLGDYLAYYAHYSLRLLRYKLS